MIIYIGNIFVNLEKILKFDFRPYSAFKFGGRNRKPNSENFRFRPKVSASGIPLELDDLEDGSTHSGISHSSNGKRHCHTCGVTGQWHTPQDCPAASRACRQCSKMGHLAKACPIGTYLTIPLLTLAKIPNQANQHSAYGSDTDSNEGTKSLATAKNIYQRQAHQTIASMIMRNPTHPRIL